MTVKPGPVLVTGANTGIGLTTTLLLAGHGWETWGTVRSKAKAADLKKEAKGAGLGTLVEPVVLDVSDHDAVVRSWPKYPRSTPSSTTPDTAKSAPSKRCRRPRRRRNWTSTWSLPRIVSACALPTMRDRRSGRIVMVSSIAGRAAIMPLNGWYHASKFGLEALSDVLRMEVAGFGVKVVIVEPGFFKTGIEPRAREQVGQRTEQAESPYRTAYARSTAALEAVARFAPPPDLVARTIVAAIESPRPLRRYLVGADALTIATTQPFIPRALTDAATRFLGGLG